MAEIEPKTLDQAAAEISGFLAAEEGEAPEKREEPQAEAQPEPQPEPQTKEEPNALQQTVQEEESNAEAEEEAVQISDLNDLANHLDVDVADLYNITVPMTVGSETRHISLSEWKDTYQKAENSRSEYSDLKSAKDAFEKERTEATGVLVARLKEAEGLVENAEKMLLADIEGTDWNELRETDPAEYAARRQEANEKIAKIQTAKEEVQRTAMDQARQRQEDFNQQMALVLEKEKTMLLDKLPEWKDENTAKTERVKLTGYLRNAGWNDTEINSMVDHRAVLALRKAMLWDEMQSAKPERKKVVSIGKKVVKPGKSQTATERKSSEYQHDLAAFQKAGGTVDAAAELINKHFLGEI